MNVLPAVKEAPGIGTNDRSAAVMLEQIVPLWSAAIARLLQELDDESFASWMRDAKPVSVDADRLVIQVPTKFTRDWVSARYGQPLRATLHKISGHDWDLQFVLPGGAEPSAAAPTAAPVPSKTSLTTVSEGTSFDTEGAAALSPTPAPVAAPVPSPVKKPATAKSAASRHGFGRPQKAALKSDRQIPLNPRYTFDSFVVGQSNRFASAACLAVAEAPAEAYNPLFIYGGVGLGKTHLMQAIAQYARDVHKLPNIVYVSSETFTNELINALQHKAMPAFRAKYRSVDMLLIDDIQFIAGKESTQEEFFHTFNSLFEVNKQIVVSSDRLPRDIPHLEERLRSRFEWGLAADIQAPDYETRSAIIQKKIADEGLPVPRDVQHLIAQQAQSNIRELEGALTRVVAYAQTVRETITVDLATRALQDFLAANRPQPVSIQTIQTCVARYYGLRTSDLTSRSRARNIAFPRQVAMYLSRTMTNSSLPAIGEQFGGRDHTTVMHGCERVRKQLEKDPALTAAVKELKEQITKGE